MCDGHGRRSVSLRVDRDNRTLAGGNRSRLLDIGGWCWEASHKLSTSLVPSL